MNDLRSLADVGRGKRLIAAYFSSSGCIPSDEIMCPAKWILLPSSSFFLEIVILYSLHLPRIMRVLSISSSIFSAQISVSSTIFLAHEIPRIERLTGSTIRPMMRLTPWGLSGI